MKKRYLHFLLFFSSKMFVMILILLVVKIEATIQLGRIQNATWLVNSSQINNEYINISNITCDQCLCRMIAMNNLTTSIACQQPRSNNTARKRPYTVVSGLKTVTVYGSPYYGYITV